MNWQKCDHIIYNTIAGSNLYGTNTPLSDIDIRGVFVPIKEVILGVDNIEQIESADSDTVYYSISKFFKLALNGNPNIIELLFAPIDTPRYAGTELLVCTDTWKKIIDNRNMFLSTKVKHTFVGYAFNQIKRIRNHRNWLLSPPKKQPERSDFGLPTEKCLMPKDQIYAFDKIIALYLETICDHHELREQLEKEILDHTDFTAISQSLRGKIPTETLTQLTGLPMNFIEYIAKENSYLKALKEYNSYEKWKIERNKERAVLEAKCGFDAKHASHVYRLLKEGRELLLTGKITFPRPEAEVLLDIKNGNWKYEQIEELFDGVDSEFTKYEEQSVLPHFPDHNKTNSILLEILVQFIEKK